MRLPMQPASDNQDYGKRDNRNEQLRFVVSALLLAVLVLFEFTLGRALEERRVTAIVDSQAHWARANFNAPDGRIPVPPKASNQQRIVFISNSHAQTGGKVANHLQALLDQLAPGRFDVLDLSAPGIFAPDMLQRALRSLDYDPDLIILNVAYISLGDRMPLRLQAHSARSFFKEGITGRLSPGFWLRNYDLGLYSSTLVSQTSRLYRYRNDVRNLWEQPLAGALRPLSDGRPIIFLEADENQSWKFPEGYDRNLFQWKLYASERDGHLQDLHELVAACKKAGVPLLATNLPVHFGKSLYEHDADDYAAYRESLREVFSDTLEFVDYEDFFPKAFSTYDALHPTWQGARLHAFDLTRRLAKHGFIEALGGQELLQAFQAGDSAISDDLRKQLDGDYPPLDKYEFRRFDLTDPVNARKLLRQLATYPVGSSQEHDFLLHLSLRLRFWLENGFAVPVTTGEHLDATWRKAVRSEIGNAQERLKYFRTQLVEFQSKRLADKQVPAIEGTMPADQEIRKISPTQSVLIHYFKLADGARVVRVSTTDGQPFVLIVTYADGTGYQRIDLIGDGSFLELRPLSTDLKLPLWVRFPEPLVRWGI